MNTQISLSSLIAGVSAVAGICGFIISRFVSATTKGKSEGVLASDIAHMQQNIVELTKSVDTLTSRLEIKGEKQEQEYRDLLVQLTANKTEISILKQEVSILKSHRMPAVGSCE